MPAERVHPRALRAGVPVEVSSLDGVRVVAVDDDADALSLLREILEAAGASVVTAHSGPAGFENLEPGDADVPIADLGMPAREGFEWMRRVRGSEIPRVRNVRPAALTEPLNYFRAIPCAIFSSSFAMNRSLSACE